MLVRAELMARERAERSFSLDQMLVGLPASQLRGGAWPVTQQRAQPDRPIEERELQALLMRALRLTTNRLRGFAPRPASEADRVEPERGRVKAGDWMLIDATSVALTVDGKAVTDPVGFRGQEVGALVFASLARRTTVDTWREVARALDFSTLILTPAPLAQVGSLPEPAGILIDVGGKTTDLTLCQGSRPVALASVKVGGAALTRALVHAWGLSPDSAERLKQAYATGKLNAADRAKVWEVMVPVVRNWLEELEAALARLTLDGVLPCQLYLSGGGSGLPELLEAAHSLAWSERLHFDRYPQVQRLGPTDVNGVVNRTALGKAPGDVAAVALAAWLGRRNKPLDRPAYLLRDLCREQALG
jgi:hypothetical protein